MMNPEKPKLFRDDVARAWSEAIGWDVSPETVSRYVRHSRPADPTTGRPAGRYADEPIRMPKYRGNVPFWEPADDETIEDVKAELVDWWMSRPGRIGDPRSSRDERGRRL